MSTEKNSSRFEIEGYVRAIEWLAMEDWELDAYDEGDRNAAGAMEEGATMALAMVFGQRYATIEEDAKRYAESVAC